ncbi:hypothetical protein CKAN_02590000 [Cinnamomum micranthum f. kanehirae]|uniref:Uncharacterized protein n=1 Tax=Cinnamomum micranthum f. kanehirae TaxID=337451 RepID=A0A3S3R9J6_9MAGN|nr:hypothetical protein CKAN_02590000 [Cinnamomum micranthum f. kanehirae]
MAIIEEGRKSGEMDFGENPVYRSERILIKTCIAISSIGVTCGVVCMESGKVEEEEEKEEKLALTEIDDLKPYEARTLRES